MKNYFTLSLCLIISSLSCQKHNQAKTDRNINHDKKAVEVPIKNGIAKAYFASGCFWCVEAVYESIPGVKDAISGYSGGYTKNPTYSSVVSGKTGHSETVEVLYNPMEVSYQTLLDIYFSSQNVEQINGQGPDIGSQYRSIIFYQNERQKKLIIDQIKKIEQSRKIKVAAEVIAFQKFWRAKDYHQNFERRNPNNIYIRNVSIPRIKRFKLNFKIDEN
ncbi:MAG: peptide-methionine (S)-S-oxide reductase [Flavobacteriaceae bacterium]|nr:peptide-methionine (S)-S-oxide reductase [Flavobacteriaceae bacterium]